MYQHAKQAREKASTRSPTVETLAKPSARMQPLQKALDQLVD